jgi:hypothetical protein
VLARTLPRLYDAGQLKRVFMGFRFRKILRIAPGVRLNISKSGGSLSLGGKGVTVNFGRKGARTTYGLPGSGLSNSNFTPYAGSGRSAWLPVLLALGLVAAIYCFYN